MADITLSYKGSTIATMSASGSKTIQTKEKYCEDDISMVYNRPILSGTDAPSNSIGNDGDVYVRSFPIPNDVTFVESLENSGDAYIDTGIYASPLIDAEVFGDRKSGNSYLGCMLGVRTGAFNNMTKALYFGSHDTQTGGVTALKIGLLALLNAPTIYNHTGNVRRKTRTIKNSDGSYTYVGIIDGISQPYSQIQSGDWVSEMPLCLYRFYNGTTLSGAAPTTIYRVTIYNNGVPVKDYLPALDANNVPCMWDNIAKEYVYNSESTGSFIAGSTLQSAPATLNDVFYIKKSGVWIPVESIS